MEGRVAVAVVIAGALAAWTVWYLGRALLIWRRLRGERIVTCPESGAPATVHIDVALAVASDGGSDAAPIEHCSRWPEHEGCGQECAAAAQLPATSASAMVKAWATGRPCALCGGEVNEPHFAGHHVALLEGAGMTREWVDVASDRLPLALATSLPVCWNCHVAATFRRLHPELVTDRDERTMHVDHGEG